MGSLIGPSGRAVPWFIAGVTAAFLAGTLVLLSRDHTAPPAPERVTAEQSSELVEPPATLPEPSVERRPQESEPAPPIVAAPAPVAGPQAEPEAATHAAEPEGAPEVAQAQRPALVIGTSPLSAPTGQRSRAAAFAAEPVDPDWREMKWSQLAASLKVIEEDLRSAQIDCRSTMCTLELVTAESLGSREHSELLRRFAEVARDGGSMRMDTVFLPDGFTSMTYLSTNPGAGASLPPDMPAGVADSFRAAIRDSAEAFAAGDSSARTWTAEEKP